MKFKVGDEVTIRSDLKISPPRSSCYPYMGYITLPSMAPLFGCTVIITQVYDDCYTVKFDGIECPGVWTDAMFVESKIETFFPGDPVIYKTESGDKIPAIVIERHGTYRMRYDLDIGVTAYRSRLERVEEHNYSIPYTPDFKKGDYVVISAKHPGYRYNGIYFSDNMSNWSGTIQQIKQGWGDKYTLTNTNLRYYYFSGLMLTKYDPGEIKVGDIVICQDRIAEVVDIVDDVHIQLKGFSKPVRRFAIQPIGERRAIKFKRDIFGIGNKGDIELAAIGKYQPDYYIESINSVSGRLFEGEFDIVVDKD